jgi:hypothetical protein
LLAILPRAVHRAASSLSADPHTGKMIDPVVLGSLSALKFATVDIA